MSCNITTATMILDKIQCHAIVVKILFYESKDFFSTV